ncbi:MAG: alpha/beta hydrolase-fold protein [Anaerolineales bacterium]
MRRRQAGGWTPILSWNLIWALALFSGASACTPVRAVTVPPPASLSSEPPASLRPLPRPTLGPAPSPENAVTPACGPGSIETVDIPTTHLPEALHASIYLPPCYQDHLRQRYPVLYLFHGLTSTDTQWIRLGAPRTADRLIAAGEIPAFIIVMPYDPSGQEPTQYGFAGAITQDLVPTIDSRYRTLPDRLHRAVGGLSRGAGWAIHLGLTRPDLFGAIGAHSVVVFDSDGMLVAGWLAAIPPGSLPRIYLDIGDDDGGLPGALLLEWMLTADDIPHEWHLNRGSHDESYWSAHVEAYLRWYTSGW